MKKITEIRVATRASLLASTQCGQTVDRLHALYPEIKFTLIIFKTLGDNVTDKPLTQFGGTGVFVKELEKALLDDEADIAVHSLKDVPNQLRSGLVLSSFPERETANDVLLLSPKTTRETLKYGGVIGTGSPRRRLQLAMMFPRCEFKELRGNIDTRMRKLHEGEYDAAVLAAAGLRRLGYNVDLANILTTDECIPAVSQGCLVMECREKDDEIIKIIRSINDAKTETAVLAEREFMRIMEGGCKLPLAGYAHWQGGSLRLSVMAGNLGQNRMVRMAANLDANNALSAAAALAQEVIKKMTEEGIEFAL